MDKTIESDILLPSPSKNSLSNLDLRISKIESLQVISENLSILLKQEKVFANTNTELKLKDLESRASRMEEKDLQKLIEISHECELQNIHLQQTVEIENMRSDIEEISFNIANDDRINSMMDEWKEKLMNMYQSLENMTKRIEKLSVYPLNQELQYLQRNIAEDRIRKEQEEVKLELIQEQVDQVAFRFNTHPSENHEIEQEIFLQGLSSIRSP